MISPVAAFTSGGPAEEDRALIAYNDAFVGHGRDVSTAGRARAHDAGNLRDTLGAHARLVEEDTAKMFAVGKDVGLVRQIGAAAVDEINARQPILLGDLLGPKMFLHGHREIGAALHGSVIGNDHHLAAGDPSDSRDDPGSGRFAFIHVVGGKLPDLQVNGAPASSSRSTCARGKSLPREIWRLRVASSPPNAVVATFWPSTRP